MKRIGIPVCAICVLLGLVVSASARRSPYGAVGLSAPYTFNGCGRTAHYVDPINVLWFGPNAVWPKVAHGLEAWGGWDHDDYKSPFTTKIGHIDHQYIGQVVSGACHQDVAQRADDCAACNRNHVRLFSTTSPAHKRYVVGDAHHDQTVVSPGSNCPIVGTFGHIASDFDGPIRDIRKFWHHHARTYYRYWGNNKSLKQCDGSFTHSQGYVLYAGT